MSTTDRGTEERKIFSWIRWIHKALFAFSWFGWAKKRSSLNTHSNELSLPTKASWATGISCYAPTQKKRKRKIHSTLVSWEPDDCQLVILSVCFQLSTNWITKIWQEWEINVCGNFKHDRGKKRRQIDLTFIMVITQSRKKCLIEKVWCDFKLLDVVMFPFLSSNVCATMVARWLNGYN